MQTLCRKSGSTLARQRGQRGRRRRCRPPYMLYSEYQCAGRGTTSSLRLGFEGGRALCFSAGTRRGGRRACVSKSSPLNPYISLHGPRRSPLLQPRVLPSKPLTLLPSHRGKAPLLRLLSCLPLPCLDRATPTRRLRPRDTSPPTVPAAPSAAPQTQTRTGPRSRTSQSGGGSRTALPSATTVRASSASHSAGTAKTDSLSR